MNTTSSEISQYLIEKADILNEELKTFLPDPNIPEKLKQAMDYSLLAGGKRIRPILSIATYEAFGKDSSEIISTAINIELLHTYSLIHDDLPAMDNDDYRRGKLTNHKVFGDAMAILAGDALLTHAFGNMAKSLKNYSQLTTDTVINIIEEFALFSGAAGMVGGQVVDLNANQSTTSFEDLIYIHTHKTGDLIVFSVRLGAMLAGATQLQLEKLTIFARKIGLAFQVQDDILDIIGDSDKLGKNVGSDQTNSKVTFPYYKGIETSKEEVRKLIIEAKAAINDIGINTKTLFGIADYLIYRDK